MSGPTKKTDRLPLSGMTASRDESRVPARTDLWNCFICGGAYPGGDPHPHHRQALIEGITDVIAWADSNRHWETALDDVTEMLKSLLREHA